MKENTGRWENKRRNKRDRKLNKEKDITILEEKCVELNFEMQTITCRNNSFLCVFFWFFLTDGRAVSGDSNRCDIG